MTPNHNISASANYTQARSRSHLKKAEDTSNVTSSIEREEAAKTVEMTKMSDRSGSVNYSAKADPPFKNRGSERSDKSTSCEEKPSSSRQKTTKTKDKKRKILNLSSESSSGASSSSKAKTSTGEVDMTNKKPKLQDDGSVEEDGGHDPTTPEGQMAMNPKLTLKAAATEAKREYNRRNAARARKRNKHMVGGLQEKVHLLTKRTEEFQRSNDVLQAQLEVLQTQNRDLLAIRSDTEPKAKVQTSNTMSQLYEQLQGNGESQQKQHQPKQQGHNITQLLNTLIGQGSSSQLFSMLQGGQQVGENLSAGIQGSGNSQQSSALWGQSSAQQQSSNLQTGMQSQSISQLLGTFGLQGQQQQQQQQRGQEQQQRGQEQQQQQAFGAMQDPRNLQQHLSSMPPEALYSMLREMSPTANNDLASARR
jgi:hypothetical protein